MKKNALIAFAVVLLPFGAAAQLTVSGKINEKESGAPLVGATVSLLKSNKAVQSMGSGKYILDNLKPGKYMLSVYYIGYKKMERTVVLDKNMIIDFEMERQEMKKQDVAMKILSDGRPITPVVEGIPCSDLEIQHLYFINLPDFAVSVEGVQVSRGVGVPDNGAGAFGGSFAAQNIARKDTAYAELNNTYGSFGTRKNNVKVGTGLINNKFSIDGRFFLLNSDGYMGRSNSNLTSYFVSGAYYGAKSLLRASMFSGKERTSQRWENIPETEVKPNRTRNQFAYDVFTDEGQTDNYTQNHYHLLYANTISNKLSFNGALHYSHSYGYYEENPRNQNVIKYGINTASIVNSNMVRRRSLDIDFYGVHYALVYLPEKALKLTFGGVYNTYKGKHLDEVMWVHNLPLNSPQRYHNDKSSKMVFSNFGRANYQLKKLGISAEVQYQRGNYSFSGNNTGLGDMAQDVHFDFLNTKLGFEYQLTKYDQLTAYFAIASREPFREDYIYSQAGNRPVPEDWESIRLGYSTKKEKVSCGISAFGLFYKNHLIGGWKSNIVGESPDKNVPKAYRIGLEWDSKIRIHRKCTWTTAAVLSKNTIEEYTELVDDSNNPGTQKAIVHRNKAIAYAPSLLASSELAFKPIQRVEIALLNKYVGKQYQDNTNNDARSISGFFVDDLRLCYSTSFKALKSIDFVLLVNNVFGKLYPINGCRYTYVEKGSQMLKGYYLPPAEQNFMLGLNAKL